jgi:dipeptidyl aminopeptidase/acylaminoacyl peptidase
VLGKSAGGYLALLCGTFQDKPNAIISFYGYGDILGDWYSQPSPHYLTHLLITQDEADKCIQSTVITNAGYVERWPLYLHSRQNGSWAALVSGHDSIEKKDMLVPYCPILNVDTHFPPTLLLHGSADADVPVEQSKDMYAALTNMGVKAELLIFPDAEHVFDAAWNYIPEEFGHITRFLKKTF